MRIEEIRLHWFRGAAEHTVLRTEGKSIAVYGPNASGKSCFTDSLEYILGGGRIGHLRHVYSGYYQQDAVRNTHAPEDQVVQIEIIFDGDRKLRADIQPEGTHTLTADPDELLEAVADWQAGELILRQDGLVKFIEQDKGTRYSALVPLLGLTSLEAAAVNVHRLEQETRSRSTLAADRQQVLVLKENAERVLGSTTEQDVLDKLGALWDRYSQDDKPADLARVIELLHKAITDRIADASPDLRLHIQLEGLGRESLNTKLSEAVTTRDRANNLVDDLLDAKLPILQRAEEFLAAIPPEQTDIGCPACGRKVEVDAFREHVHGELGTLKEARAARDAAEAARTSFVTSLRNAQAILSDPLVSSWTDTSMTREAFEIIRGVDSSTFSEGTDIDPLKTLLPQVEMAQALIAEKVKVAPRDMGELSADSETVSSARCLLQAQALEASCERIENLLGGIASLETALRKEVRNRTQRAIEDIPGDVQELWAILHPTVPITGVQLYIPPDDDKAIDIALNFYGKEQPSPRNTLSEGYRNSLGICIFLALLLRDERKGWPIVLDDVVSSFDRDHRGFLVDVLRQHFSDRQVIILTHDREWFAELKGRLPQDQWKFSRLGFWTGPDSGIRVIDATHTFEEALELVETHPAPAATMARGITDRRLAMIAERVKLPMPFLAGDANDHRMAVEFLDRLTSETRTRLQQRDGDGWKSTDHPLATWQETKSLLIYWANPPTHGHAGAVEECKRLIESCDQTLSALDCSVCKRPVWELNDTGNRRLCCRCGQLRWKYGGPAVED